MQSLRLLGALILTWGCAATALGAEWKDKADAEGKLVFYSTSNTADAKALTDAFNRLYPKIEVQFDRASDSRSRYTLGRRAGITATAEDRKLE